jgi:hypothetical protein
MKKLLLVILIVIFTISAFAQVGRTYRKQRQNNDTLSVKVVVDTPIVTKGMYLKNSGFKSQSTYPLTLNNNVPIDSCAWFWSTSLNRFKWVKINGNYLGPDTSGGGGSGYSYRLFASSSTYTMGDSVGIAYTHLTGDSLIVASFHIHAYVRPDSGCVGISFGIGITDSLKSKLFRATTTPRTVDQNIQVVTSAVSGMANFKPFSGLSSDTVWITTTNIIVVKKDTTVAPTRPEVVFAWNGYPNDWFIQHTHWEVYNNVSSHPLIAGTEIVADTGYIALQDDSCVVWRQSSTFNCPVTFPMAPYFVGVGPQEEDWITEAQTGTGGSAVYTRGFYFWYPPFPPDPGNMTGSGDGMDAQSATSLALGHQNVRISFYKPVNVLFGDPYVPTNYTIPWSACPDTGFFTWNWFSVDEDGNYNDGTDFSIDNGGGGHFIHCQGSTMEFYPDHWPVHGTPNGATYTVSYSVSLSRFNLEIARPKEMVKFLYSYDNGDGLPFGRTADSLIIATFHINAFSPAESFVFTQQSYLHLKHIGAHLRLGSVRKGYTIPMTHAQWKSDSTVSIVLPVWSLGPTYSDTLRFQVEAYDSLDWQRVSKPYIIVIKKTSFNTLESNRTSNQFAWHEYATENKTIKWYRKQRNLTNSFTNLPHVGSEEWWSCLGILKT